MRQTHTHKQRHTMALCPAAVTSIRVHWMEIYARYMGILICRRQEWSRQQCMSLKVNLPSSFFLFFLSVYCSCTSYFFFLCSYSSCCCLYNLPSISPFIPLFLTPLLSYPLLHHFLLLLPFYIIYFPSIYPLSLPICPLKGHRSAGA